MNISIQNAKQIYAKIKNLREEISETELELSTMDEPIQRTLLYQNNDRNNKNSELVSIT